MSMMTFMGIIPIIPGIVKALVSGKKVMDVINRVPKIISKDNAVVNIQLNNSIEFKGVHFKYPTAIEKTRPTLEGVDFKIKAGTSTAIVGPSGSGKSTIVQLINRYYDPLEGSIYFDKTDLKDLSLTSLRETIGYVS
jgi:ABC-type multidrug transport system fused ATPase/permease subunit